MLCVRVCAFGFWKYAPAPPPVPPYVFIQCIEAYRGRESKCKKKKKSLKWEASIVHECDSTRFVLLVIIKLEYTMSLTFSFTEFLNLLCLSTSCCQIPLLITKIIVWMLVCDFWTNILFLKSDKKVGSIWVLVTVSLAQILIKHLRIFRFCMVSFINKTNNFIFYRLTKIKKKRILQCLKKVNEIR